MADSDRTASLMSPAKLAQMKPKPAVSPAAWLNQMAADAGHQHVARIAELADALQAQARSPGLAPIAASLERLAALLPGLDFSLLEPRGWWARATGKGGSGGEAFSERVAQIDEATRALREASRGVGPEREPDPAGAERALVELEVEYRALEKIIDQGARWLQDMRTQLKARQAAATNVQAQQEVLQDSARCDILVTRLKQLRQICNSAAQVRDLAKANREGRAGLAQTLQQSLAADVKDWTRRIGPLAAALSAGKAAATELDRPMEVHGDLQASVVMAQATCTELLAKEQGLSDSLAMLAGGQAAA